MAVDRTPLHYAAASRHFQCLETLVSCGTSINATDHWGRSAVHYAAASDLDRRYTFTQTATSVISSFKIQLNNGCGAEFVKINKYCIFSNRLIMEFLQCTNGA